MKNIQQIYIEFKPFCWALIPRKIENKWNYSNYKREYFYSFLQIGRAHV